MKQAINSAGAPEAIGTYSQAVQVDNTVFLSGQIALIPETMLLVVGDIAAEIEQVLRNLQAVCQAAGGSLQHIVKLNVYLCDLSHYQLVNTIMRDYFVDPYPARAAIQVSALPKKARVEMDGIMKLSEGE